MSAKFSASAKQNGRFFLFLRQISYTNGEEFLQKFLRQNIWFLQFVGLIQRLDYLTKELFYRELIRWIGELTDMTTILYC
jgi:hypothetical protein